MKSSIFVLHLSDLHIDPANTAESAPVYRDLCAKLRKFREDRGTSFDLIVISGDFVSKGAVDYGPVERVVEDIREASGVDPGFIFMVPGNHDVQRGLCKHLYSHVLASLKKDPIDELPKLSNEAKQQLRPGFKMFSQFAQKYPLHSAGRFDLPGFWQADIEISNVPFRLCGINSAIVAGPGDSNKKDNQLKDRVLGMHLLNKMLDANGRLKLVVSHYPLSWLNIAERKEAKERLAAARAVFFHGHTHEPATDIEGVTANHQMLVLGVGSLYGQKWQGRNHCQILELCFHQDWPRLHEWFWSGTYGWRGIEPLELGWNGWKSAEKPAYPNLQYATSGKKEGLVDFGRGRDENDRIAYYQRAIDLAANETVLIFLGRSLIDLSSLADSIEGAISKKRIKVKLGLLDENAVIRGRDGKLTGSWIEKPAPKDWAIEDVPTSMNRFRRIKVGPGLGSLEIYGLPFYLTHSFAAYTNKLDGFRYCLEETGMALPKNDRPFLELKSASSDGFASSLEANYRSILTEDRLIVRRGLNPVEKDTTRRANIIVPKVEKCGLVDLGTRDDIDWRVGEISSIIKQTPDHGEIFIVGRSLVIWANNHMELVEAINKRGLRCIFVIADPTMTRLRSLVGKDYAEKDLPTCWEVFKESLHPRLKKPAKGRTGLFAIYGLPTYVPDTFGAFMRSTGQDVEKYCTLESGIGVGPSERAILYFKNVSEDDMYTKLNRIYRGIIKDRKPLLHFPTPR